MEKVDQTINAVCDWIQENLTDIGCMESTMVMPEMVKALAELVNSQIKLSVNESVGKLKEVKGMSLPEKLETLVLDCKTGKLLLNGERVSSVNQFSLEFNNGEWHLGIQQYKRYKASGKAAPDSTAQEFRE